MKNWKKNQTWANQTTVRVAMVALVIFLPAANAAQKKDVATTWSEFARKSQSDDFQILPLLAITQALEAPDLPAGEKKKLIGLATRLAAHPGTSPAATALAVEIMKDNPLRDWQWFAGLADLEQGNARTATEHFSMVRKGDRNFARARYQIAVNAYNNKHNIEAEAGFKEILAATPAPDNDLQDLTKLGLGRLWYEEKKFQSAAAAYRTVSRKGRYFQTALFEQSWSFFMAGYPNHALGAIHGVESPFFAESFTPEATLLRSMILYWMCLYHDSDQALQEFIARHAEPIDQLERFLARQQLNPQSAWELFENMLAGVSSESLSIPRSILMTAANSDRLVPFRIALAQATEEMRMLESGKLQGISIGPEKARAQSLMQTHLKKLRLDTGKSFIVALANLRSQYEQLRAQADFLYVELLTSEKDKILGKEHLSINKFGGNQATGKKPAGWGKGQLAWAPNSKQEYWWDEVGFYIDPAKSACIK